MATGTIKVETTITITDTFGKKNSAKYTKETTGLTAVDEGRNFNLVANETRTIWDPNNEATENNADFDVLIIIADGDVDIELTVDEGGSPQVSTVRVTDQIPLILGSDDAYNASGGVGFSGTLALIDKIRADEPAGAARTLKLIMAT